MTTLLHQADPEKRSKSEIRPCSIFVVFLKLLVLWPLYIVLGYYLVWAVIYVVVEAVAQVSRMFGG